MPKARRPAGVRRQRPETERSQQAPVLIALNKPYDVLPQFTDDLGRSTLKTLLISRVSIGGSGWIATAKACCY